MFIPQIPLDYLDFVNSPVPFIGGLITDNISKLRNVLNNNQIKNTASDGIIILNLNTGEIVSDEKTKVKEKVMASS